MADVRREPHHHRVPQFTVLAPVVPHEATLVDEPVLLVERACTVVVGRPSCGFVSVQENCQLGEHPIFVGGGSAAALDGVEQVLVGARRVGGDSRYSITTGSMPAWRISASVLRNVPQLGL